MFPQKILIIFMSKLELFMKDHVTYSKNIRIENCYILKIFQSITVLWCF